MGFPFGIYLTAMMLKKPERCSYQLVAKFADTLCRHNTTVGEERHPASLASIEERHPAWVAGYVMRQFTCLR